MFFLIYNYVTLTFQEIRVTLIQISWSYIWVKLNFLRTEALIFQPNICCAQTELSWSLSKIEYFV